MQRFHSPRGTPVLLLALGIAILLFLAYRQQKAWEKVEGTVVDSAGKPVADVRVFNTGDGPKPVEAYTDASGRFCLQALTSGPVYVFADKTGYRFAGVRTTAGATGVVIKLLRQAEPAPQRAVASESMPLDQRQKHARKMLEKLWAEDSRSKQYYWVTMAMSRIDPELALRWSAESDTGCAGLIRAAMAEKIADADLDEALSLMAQSGPDRLNALIKLAHRYTVSDPAKAMRCAEELVVGARAVDQPWRAGYLAQAGSLVIQLGDKNAGWKLLDEAGTMAAKLGSERQHAGARGMAAEAMAPSDLKRALALLEPITRQNGPDRFRANVAVAICRQNLEQALAIVAKMASAYDANGARLRIAYRLAPTRPADAVRVAESMGSSPRVPRASEAQAMALGWVAVAVAPRDKPLACSLIDRAFAIIMTPDASESSLDYFGGRPALAAFLVVQAERSAYPDMESIIYRVLACRPTEKNPSAAARSLESMASEVFMATLLGLVDPQTARGILESIESLPGTLGFRSNGPGSAAWVKAWLLVDAKRGQALFDGAVASIRNKPGTDTEFYEIVEAAALLAAPPHEKVQHVVSHLDYRLPEEE